MTDLHRPTLEAAAEVARMQATQWADGETAQFASNEIARDILALGDGGGDGWQTIDSAPKDGTIIDVWLGNASEDDVQFYCTEGGRRSPAWSWKQGKFRPLGGLDVAMPVFVEPTHWRPLPSPPSVPQLQPDSTGEAS
jgi:hypothetical protein